MTETKLFVSSCSRRELARRRHQSIGALALSVRPGLAALLIAVIGVAAFFAGRGAI